MLVLLNYNLRSVKQLYPHEMLICGTAIDKYTGQLKNTYT
jgi:hypothetical protein